MAATFIPGNPPRTCSQLSPESLLRKTPSRDASHKVESALMATSLTAEMYWGRLAANQLCPPSTETATPLRAPTIIRFSRERTATHSLCPATGPPVQVVPRSELM